MIGQKTIQSFFLPVAQKRTSSKAFDKKENAAPGETTPVKRFRAAKDDDEVLAVVSPPLSPDQLGRIQRNKQAALQKLATRSVPEGFGETWKEALSGEFVKPYFAKLTTFVAEERKRGTVYPPPHQVFTWTQMCPIRDVKVVILGQDPYHGPNQAHGLCFSVQRPVPPPPSLENMYKELITDIEGFTHPGHGDLTGWAKQGVLLLNAVLTVKAHNANSHKDRGWEQFTDAVISWLNKNLDGLVFMLWGAYAQKKGSSIDRTNASWGDGKGEVAASIIHAVPRQSRHFCSHVLCPCGDQKRHNVLQAVHPSPLSVHRGFYGCKHFSKTNEILARSGKALIDWKKL
ncbi:uracil-DNA glycosylase isoform X2 [Ambystoma mexicanum]|uniref:uracil-DNA glycosylase isoform X2 n=1 Tax=Ambystoma mexicanum TaxID=8296 RepID=UPI0037E727BC